MEFTTDYPSKPPKCMHYLILFAFSIKGACHGPFSYLTTPTCPSLFHTIQLQRDILHWGRQASLSLLSFIQMCIHREQFVFLFWTKKRDGDQLLVSNKFCWEFKIFLTIQIQTVPLKALPLTFLWKIRWNTKSEFEKKPERMRLKRTIFEYTTIFPFSL